MEIPEWIISAFDVEVESANLDVILKEKFIEIPFNLKVEFIHSFEDIGYCWTNEKLKKNIQSLSSFCNVLSSSCRAGSTDIPDPLSPLLPIVHRPRQVLRTTSRILT